MSTKKKAPNSPPPGPSAPTLPTLMEFIAAKQARRCRIKIVVGTFMVMDWRVTLEDTAFVPGDFTLNGSFYEKELKDFEVRGTLDALLDGRGNIGGAVAARITCDGKVLTPDLEVILKNLHGFDAKSYVI